MLQGGSADSEEDGRPQFAEIFVIIWFGSVYHHFQFQTSGRNYVSKQSDFHLYLFAY